MKVDTARGHGHGPADGSKRGDLSPELLLPRLTKKSPKIPSTRSSLRASGYGIYLSTYLSHNLGVVEKHHSHPHPPSIGVMYQKETPELFSPLLPECAQSAVPPCLSCLVSRDPGPVIARPSNRHTNQSEPNVVMHACLSKKRAESLKPAEVRDATHFPRGGRWRWS